MFAAASTLFGKSSTLSAYTVHGNGPSPSASSTNLAARAGGSGRASPAPGAHAHPFQVGLWKVMSATHKTTGKDVSVWVFEKRQLDSLRGGREYVIEQLKKEATSLSRLRHPDTLHMVEPLEESRTELTFVTETVTASLGNVFKEAKSGASRSRDGEVDLDEVEIQKGILQVAKGLAFLHTQAKSVHLNLNPDAILINAKGDWKLSGLNLITPLTGPDGAPTKAQFPEVDTRLPPQVQWKLDYLAPEYALDSQLSPANDLYSLGCVLFAVHNGGRPPFSNKGSMSSLRESAEGQLVRKEYARGALWQRCSSELKELIPKLLTRTPSGRMSLQSLPSHPFFSSLAISTLNFLDPTTFASKPREEKATFLRGLVRVLPNFSDRLKKGKILLSLLEEMKDPYLLPFLLPNVFEISKVLSKEEFAIVLPKLQPLFALKDPAQNMLTLLENLPLLEEKTTPAVFRESVMPLIYNSLESEHLQVQERVLKTVPHLCEILDYGTVQNVLLVKIAIVFTRTRILSVKVQTLECFRAMVSTLDATTLTTKLVPLLAKIKTKEPAVMMATLSVHEAMGAKVGVEQIATLVLPQLWSMSIGPLLNADQFGRFMTVIKSLGARVEKEHSQHLREVRKMEEQTSGLTNGASDNPFDFSNSQEVDFESLVKGGGSSSAAPPATSPAADPWNDGWNDTPEEPSLSSLFPGLSVSPGPSAPPAASGSTSPRRSTSKLGARPVPSSNFNQAAFSPPTQSRQPSFSSTLQPTSSQPRPAQASASSGPNYNISLTPQVPKPKPMSPTLPTFTPMQPVRSRSPSQAQPQPSFGSGMGMGGGGNMGGMGGMGAMGGMGSGMGNQSSSLFAAMSATPPAPKPAAPAQPSAPAPPGWGGGGLMQPTVAPKPAWGAAQAASADWGDFDPLK